MPGCFLDQRVASKIIPKKYLGKQKTTSGSKIWDLLARRYFLLRSILPNFFRQRPGRPPAAGKANGHFPPPGAMARKAPVLPAPRCYVFLGANKKDKCSCLHPVGQCFFEQLSKVLKAFDLWASLLSPAFEIRNTLPHLWGLKTTPKTLGTPMLCMPVEALLVAAHAPEVVLITLIT